MRCREFLNNHVSYVDDVLSGAEMDAMDRHRSLCPSCARHDAAVRRSLLLVRNLPSIQPSADFYERLQMRIRQGAVLEDRRGTRAYLPSIGNVAALAAGLAAVGYVAMQAARSVMHPDPAPAVAAAGAAFPKAAALSFQTPALAAIMPTELATWPDEMAPGPVSGGSVRGRPSPFVQASLTH